MRALYSRKHKGPFGYNDPAYKTIKKAIENSHSWLRKNRAA